MQHSLASQTGELEGREADVRNPRTHSESIGQHCLILATARGPNDPVPAACSKTMISALGPLILPHKFSN